MPCFLDPVPLLLIVIFSSPQRYVESAGVVREALNCQEFTCPTPGGIYPISPESCSQHYYLCSNWNAYEESCPDGYVFDPATNRCVELGLASCSPKATTPYACVTVSTATTSIITSTSTTESTSTSTASTSKITTTQSTTSSTETSSSSTPSTTSTTQSTTTSTESTSTSTPATTSATESTTTSTESTSTSTPSTTLPSTIQSTASTSGGFVCPGTGFFPYDGYCSKSYWACTDSGHAFLLKCPGDLVFNPDTSKCVEASTIPECQQIHLIFIKQRV